MDTEFYYDGYYRSIMVDCRNSGCDILYLVEHKMMSWVGLLLFTASLTTQIDKEFTTEKECWDWYNIPSNYSKIGTPVLTHQGKPIPEDHHFKWGHLNYPIRLYKDSNKHLIWLTCESSKRLKQQNVPLMNILIPPPE